MNAQSKLLFSMMLMILLPLSVTIVTWFGLLQMDIEIKHVIEEFAEARSLQPVDNDLSVALLALNQDEDELDSLALEHLQNAETILLEYLAAQYDDSGSAEHQAEEAHLASDALSQLSELVGPSWTEQAKHERIEHIQRIRQDIHDLYRMLSTEPR